MMTSRDQVQMCPTGGVVIPADRIRKGINETAVSGLMESISKIGLRTPITVTVSDEDGSATLVAGAHRLEAVKRLGWPEIPAICVQGWSEDEARMWEISENLSRAELTALERDEHVAEWIKLAEKPRQADAVSKGGRGNESGVRKAARDLGLSEPDARRATKVAGLSDEAKQAARQAGLDNNRSALLAAATVKSKGGSDVGYLRQEAERREAERRNNTANRVVQMSAAEDFAQWILARTDLSELPTIISWLQGTSAKDVIASMRRMAA